ncbi:MAG: DUF1223 domain-containing protein [Rhodobacter sp.]|nr:DUF1223 domain-containing protein [Rhodobacter sp.]
MALIARSRAEGKLRNGAQAASGWLVALLLVLVPPGPVRAQSAPAPAPVAEPADAGSGAGSGAAVVDHPVLLELYTAQGCASCPPADDMMVDLAQRDDVVALALHVDYWDYIGWADTFADRAFTERQQRYARRFGHSTIYTPQVVINGTQVLEGFRVDEVLDTILSQHARPPEVTLSLTRTDAGALEISAVPAADAAPQVVMASRRSAVAGVQLNSVVGTLSMGAPAETENRSQPQADTAAVPPPVPSAGGPYTVQLVRYRPEATVDILDGENAGRVADYANIVTSWQVIAGWDLRAPLYLTVPLDGDDPVVVLVQEAGQGEVLAAARLR